MKQFIVEVSSKRQHKKMTRYRFDGDQKIMIGRSYACDIILDDPYVSDKHIKISAGTDFTIEDSGSENGTYIGKKKLHNDKIDINSGAEIHIGHTIVKIFSDSHAISPVHKMNWANDLRELFLKPVIAALLVCLATGISIFYECVFSRDLDYFEEDIYSDSIDEITFIALLAFLFYVFSLLSKHTFKITAAISYACLFSIVISIISFLPKIIFAASLSLYGTEIIISLIVSLAISGAVLFVSYLENSKIKLKDWLGVIAIIVIMQGLVVYDHHFSDEYDVLEPHYESSMSAFGWVPDKAVSVEAFLEGTDIFEEIEDKPEN